MTVRPGTQSRRSQPTEAELEDARTAFLDAVCDQVNTPLTLMLGPLRESLDDDRLPPEERHRVAMAHRAALRLLNLVDSLDDLARIELGLARVPGELVDLAQVVTDVVVPFQSLMKLAGLRLDIDRGESGVVVLSDRDLLEKALLHLVSNAFKHTKEGEIRVRVARVGAQAEVSVIDTGIGIPEPELPRVFERFFRVRGAWARTQEGSGLGLALVKAAAELQDGAVRVESRPGVGSAFTISLPVAPVDTPVTGPARAASLAASRLLEEAAAWKAGQEEDGAEPHPAARAPAAERPRIVVAEDSADLRAHLLHVLRRDWDVVGTVDGAEALALVGQEPADLVLAEVVLPRLDGLALLRALRANPATAMVPVMLIASRPGEEAAVDALELGPDDYLVKPFSGRLLVARIRANLASARARRRNQAQLQASLEISQATLTGEGSEAVLKLVAHRARDLLEADGAHVAVPAAGGGGLAVTVGEDCACDDTLAVAGQQGGELVGETFGGTLLVATPLAVQNRQIGLLTVCRHAGGNPFGPEDAQLLALFANQAAVAMEQGRVHQEMQRLAVMEEERGRIARDIHDDTLQSLGAIALRLGLVANRLTDEEQRRSVEGLLELTRDSAERLRTLVFDLRADVLEQGLVPALQSYVFEAPTPLGLRCRIDSRLTTEPPMHISLVLYRVVQEALTNVRKHAAASAATLSLDGVRGGVRLRVHDDGSGFDLSAGPGAPGHLGLAGMRERVQLAGGRLSIETSPGQGTTVQVWMPVPGGMQARLP